MARRDFCVVGLPIAEFVETGVVITGGVSFAKPLDPGSSIALVIVSGLRPSPGAPAVGVTTFETGVPVAAGVLVFAGYVGVALNLF